MITKFVKLGRICARLSCRPVVLAAGMPRSSSTLLYNIVREVLEEKWHDGLSYCWTRDVLNTPRGRAYLIKTHSLGRLYRLRASHSFYSYRDIRVATVSAYRMFGWPISIERMRRQVIEYRIARKFCNTCFSYENLISSPRSVVQKVSEQLSIPVDTDHIVSKVEKLAIPESGPDYCRKTQLHIGHFTHTGDDDWRSIIPVELQDRIHREFSWWFRECGYPTK